MHRRCLATYVQKGRRRKTLAPTEALAISALAEEDENPELDQVVGDQNGSATTACSTPVIAVSRSSIPRTGSETGASDRQPVCVSAPTKSNWEDVLLAADDGAVGVCKSGPRPSPGIRLHSPFLCSSPRNKVRPWQGKLPSPRRSPKLTVGDALSKAQWRCSPGQRGVRRLTKTRSLAGSVEPLPVISKAGIFGKPGDRAYQWDTPTPSTLESWSQCLNCVDPRRTKWAQWLKLSLGIP